MITALCEAQLWQKHYADRQQHNDKFIEGDLVLLSTANLSLLTMSKKLSAKFVGPFKILKHVSSVVYHLEIHGKMHIHPVFHIS